VTETRWWSVGPVEGRDPARGCVLALDPGLRHGLAHLHRDGRTEAGEADWQPGLELLESLLTLCGAEGPVHLVGEAFFITTETGKKSQAPWSLEGLGVARYLAARHGVRLDVQAPTDAKGFGTRARLKQRGWWVPTDGGHAVDALRHLYLWLAKHEGVLPPRGVV
jgi:hypothetical protein